MRYGHAFITQDDFEGLDVQTQQEIRGLSGQQGKALCSKIVEVAQSITPDQCGQVLGTFGLE